MTLEEWRNITLEQCYPVWLKKWIKENPNKTPPTLEYFAIHCGLPTQEYIKQEMELDKARNPHNESYKPKRRTADEIIVDWKYKFAQLMIDRFPK